MQEARTITVMTGRTQTELEVSEIHYVLMNRNYADIHMEWGGVCKARITFEELVKLLGDDFLPIRRGCLVSADQIHHIDDMVVLNSGERLKYVRRQKKALVSEICALRNCPPESIAVKVRRSPKRETPPATALEEPAPPAVEEEEELPAARGPEADVRGFSDGTYLSITVKRKRLMLNVDTILYADVEKNIAQIHLVDGTVHRTRIPLSVLEKGLGDGFLKVSRHRLVSVMAIHSVTDTVNLSNGEALDYTRSRKAQLCKLLASRQKLFIDSLSDEGTPATPEEYRAHYRCFEDAPFAFADIEMVFSDERYAVDWIFRYGNPALARLEKIPLKKLIGNSFGSLFANMDAKWLRCYEQAALYGKTLEIVSYSPEIDTNLKIICYPTFKGHCGCILFNLDAADGQLNALNL